MLSKINYFFNILPFFVALRIVILRGIKKLLALPIDFTYSMYGEDFVLSELFKNTTKGFYVDIGCYKPIEASNTFLLYLKGWSGLAIDANESVLKSYSKVRVKDSTVFAVLSNKVDCQNYYKFKNGLLNTIDKKVAQKHKSISNLIGVEEIQTSNVNDVLSVHLKSNQKIDFLNIDIEGLDFDVIKTLDFDRFSPNVIAIEIHDLNLSQIEINPICIFLKGHGYNLYAQIHITSIFIHQNFQLND